MYTLTEEEKAHLNRICAQCGEYFGRHRATDSACPIIEDRRTIGYRSSPYYFKEWIDDNPQKS